MKRLSNHLKVGFVLAISTLFLGITTRAQIWTQPLTSSPNDIGFGNPVTRDMWGGSANTNISAATFFFNKGAATNTSFPTSNTLQNNNKPDQVRVTGWTQRDPSAPSSSSTPFDPDEYFTFTLTVADGFEMNFTNLSFNAVRGNTNNPNTFEIRTDKDGDNFATTVGTAGTLSGAAGAPETAIYSLPSLTHVTGSITLRLYFYGGKRAYDPTKPTTGNVQDIFINDFVFNGTVDAATPMPVHFGPVSAKAQNNALSINWQTLSEANNHHFEIEASKDGKNFSRIGMVLSKAARGNSIGALDYTFSISRADAETLAGIPAILMLLATGFIRNKKWMIAGLFFAALVMSVAGCSKSDRLPAGGNNDLFIKIKQVDIDGGFEYSKIIKVVAD